MLSAVAAGVAPETAPMVSHGGLPAVELVHFSDPVPVFEIAMLTGAGLPPPCTAAKVNAEGKTDNCGAADAGRPVSLKTALAPSPATLAEIVIAPAAEGVAVICAFPSPPVNTAGVLRVAAPEVRLNTTMEPTTGEPDASVTRATRGAANAVPCNPACPLPLTTEIPAGGGGITVKVPLTKVKV